MWKNGEEYPLLFFIIKYILHLFFMINRAIKLEDFINILSDPNDQFKTGWVGCNITQGLLIIQKYLPQSEIEGAGKNIIYSVDIKKLIDAGITKEDAIKLRKLNWMVEDGQYLACFV